jgi:hypothetical protein
MLSGTDEHECRGRPPTFVSAPRYAVNGADQADPKPAVISASANDPPQSEATKIIARATIHPTVNGKASTAGCLGGSPAAI